jgi:hypothetical protein
MTSRLSEAELDRMMKVKQEQETEILSPVNLEKNTHVGTSLVLVRPRILALSKRRTNLIFRKNSHTAST